MSTHPPEPTVPEGPSAQATSESLAEVLVDPSTMNRHPTEVFGFQAPSRAVRAVCGLGNLSFRTGLNQFRFDPDELRQQAEKRTGYRDWGADFNEEPFELLLESARTDARLNFVGAFTLSRYIGRILGSWLTLVNHRKRFRQHLQQPIQNPIIVVGMPRSGTTMMQHLLAAHPDAMFLPMWLAMRPLPPPTEAEWNAGGRPDVRRSAATSATVINALSPDMERIHPFHVDHPVECTHLVAPSFQSNQLGGWPVYTYLEQSDGFDPMRSYRVYRDYLQLMQPSLPGSHWLLKSPGHWLTVEALFEALPEAKVVMLHRDPASVFPSLNCMMAAHHVMMTDHPDGQRMSNLLLRLFRDGAMRYVDIMDRYADRKIDVRFPDLIEDPIAVAERVADFAGVRWDGEVQTAHEAYVERRKVIRAPRFPYPKRQYGYTPESVRRYFGRYLDAVGLDVS